MTYIPGGPYTVAGAFTNANANNLETQWLEAMNSFGPDLLGAGFVIVGGVGTIHGGLPKQMDVTQCFYVAFQSTGNPAGTFRRFIVNATNFTTVTASTTYFLDYNADGTTSWATSHSGVANYIPIASVTTDGSGNISVITDARPTTVNMWPGAIGYPQMRGIAIPFLYTNGGGSAGKVIWEGTTDPGGLAVEGDIWAKG